MEITTVDQMDRMIQEAKERGLWLVSNYQQIWFSPRQLQVARAKGKFLWGPENWTLKPASDKIAQLKREQACLESEIADIMREIGRRDS